MLGAFFGWLRELAQRQPRHSQYFLLLALAWIAAVVWYRGDAGIRSTLGEPATWLWTAAGVALIAAAFYWLPTRRRPMTRIVLAPFSAPGTEKAQQRAALCQAAVRDALVAHFDTALLARDKPSVVALKHHEPVDTASTSRSTVLRLGRRHRATVVVAGTCGADEKEPFAPRVYSELMSGIERWRLEDNVVGGRGDSAATLEAANLATTALACQLGECGQSEYARVLLETQSNYRPAELLILTWLLDTDPNAAMTQLLALRPTPPATSQMETNLQVWKLVLLTRAFQLLGVDLPLGDTETKALATTTALAQQMAPGWPGSDHFEAVVDRWRKDLLGQAVAGLKEMTTAYDRLAQELVRSNETLRDALENLETDETNREAEPGEPS